MRIAFAGTPQFAAVALQALLAARHEVALVLTQPDRPAGRGMKLQPSAVKTLAQQHDLALAQPAGLKLDGRFGSEAQAAHRALLAARPDVIVVAAYGLILPAWLLELPRWGCLNIHASLLPRWRGAAPIQRAIEAGDRETGITIMQMDAGLDTGACLLMRAIAIEADDTAARLHDRLAALGGTLIVEALARLARGELQPTPQPADGITYAHKIEKHEASLDWRAPASTLERRVRAFDPFPGATLNDGGQLIKVWRAAVHAEGAGAPGEVISTLPGPLRVACGEGALELLELQRPGGRRLPAQQALGNTAPALGRRLALPGN
jgi:methionyl-tRNA formyltransferase